MKKIILVLLFVALSFCFANSQLKKQDFRLNKAEFIENRGQFIDADGNQCTDIKYICKYNGQTIYLRKNGISFVFSRGDSNSTLKTPLDDFDSQFENKEQRLIKYQRADIDFVDIKDSFQIETTEKPKYFINYYLPKCPDGLLNVPVYQKVIYKNIYDNIDIVFYESNNQLEYDILVNPGGNPDLVQFKTSGFDEIKMDESGSIFFETAIGKVEQTQPKTYQNNLLIESNFVVNGNEFQIKSQQYDKTKQLRIDPIIRLWGTYLGGSNLDQLVDIIVNNKNEYYLVGWTHSDNIITTAGAWQESKASSQSSDGLIIKLDENGERIWATYYGGNAGDQLRNACFDNDFNLLAIGMSESDNYNNSIATSGTHQTYCGGRSDAIIIKFNPEGQRIWGTYLGGTEQEVGYQIFEKDNSIYINGWTGSNNTNNCIATKNAHQAQYSGGKDAFIAKFNNYGQRIWSTYYGGNNEDGSEDIWVDNGEFHIFEW